MWQNRNRPFRELQKGYADARLHEKCHALCFSTQQDALGWAAACQRHRLPAGNGVRRIPEYKTAAPQGWRRDVLSHDVEVKRPFSSAWRQNKKRPSPSTMESSRIRARLMTLFNDHVRSIADYEIDNTSPFVAEAAF